VGTETQQITHLFIGLNSKILKLRGHAYLTLEASVFLEGTMWKVLTFLNGDKL